MKPYSGLLISFLSFMLASFTAFQVFSYQAVDEMNEVNTVEQTISANSELAKPELSAKAFLAFNLKTGKLIISQNESSKLPIASVTKLFTAVVVNRNPDLDATTTINWTDLNTEGEAGKLHYGDIYSHRELLFPLLLESSNDAATALNRSSDGLVLTKLNELAKKVGANDTVFTDTSGLDSTDVSTVLDLKKLLTDVYQNDQLILDITKLPQYLSRDNGWINNNPVYAEEGYVGGKHGYTETANRTLVAIFNEKIKGEETVVGYILLGSNNLKKDVNSLRNYVAKENN